MQVARVVYGDYVLYFFVRAVHQWYLVPVENFITCKNDYIIIYGRTRSWIIQGLDPEEVTRSFVAAASLRSHSDTTLARTAKIAHASGGTMPLQKPSGQFAIVQLLQNVPVAYSELSSWKTDYCTTQVEFLAQNILRKATIIAVIIMNNDTDTNNQRFIYRWAKAG